MIQLSFQPALDPFHTIFRLIRLRDIISAVGELSVDHVRILDFYLAFPFRIDGLRLLPAHRRFRTLAKRFEGAKPYGEQPADDALFGRMAPFQVAGMETLASNGLLDALRLKTSWVRPTGRALPEELVVRVGQLNAQEEDLLDLLRVLAEEYHVGGTNGLKHRTGLMEYRYDVV